MHTLPHMCHHQTCMPTPHLHTTQTQNDKTWFRGTADAIRQFVWLLEDSQNRSVEHVVILAADQIYRMDYMGMVQEHVQSGADLTIACTRLSVTPSRASKLGLMKLGEDGWVTDFAEKPQGAAVQRFAVGGGGYYSNANGSVC